MKNNFEAMRKAHETQAKKIRTKSCFDRISEEFDIEYQIARDLQLVRKRKQLTQAELAKRMGTTQSVVSRVEQGANVSIETLARYVAACGATLKVKIA